MRLRGLWSRSLLALPALALLMVLPPGLASAATRHAAPAGDGPQASCPLANPCSIEDAIEGPAVADGDEIVLADGNYPVAGTLMIAGEITVRGRTLGFFGARIISNADPAVFMITPAARLRDLILVRNGPSGRALLIANGIAERVVVAAPQSIACVLGSADAGNAVIRNAACSGGVYGVLAAKTDLGLEFAVLDGVTAHTQAGEHAILALGESDGQINLSLTNTIALGGTKASLGAEAEAANSARADVAASSSAFATTSQTGAITTVPAPGSGTNISTPATLVNPVGADFRQVAGSPTIDAGIAGPGSGPFDFAGDPRNQAGRIDIGADEALGPPERLLQLIPKKLRPGRRMVVSAQCPASFCEITARARIETLSKKNKRVFRKPFKPAAGGGADRIKLKLKLGKRTARRVKRFGRKLGVTAFATDPTGIEDTDTRLYKIRKKR